MAVLINRGMEKKDNYMIEKYFSEEVINRIVKTSQHLIMCEPPNNEPIKFGCGCILEYKNHLFLLTASHVTKETSEHPNLQPCIELGRPPEFNNDVLGTCLFNVGSKNMCYLDEYKIPEEFKNKIISFKENLDIAACILDEKFKNNTNMKPPYEKGWPNEKYTIVEGNRIYLNFEKDIAVPNEDKKYGLYGRIKYYTEGFKLNFRPALKLGLNFKGNFGRFCLFNTQEIVDIEEWEGCSGSPIFDNFGKLVAITSTVNNGDKAVFGFSIEYCKLILDIAIDN